MDKFLKTTIPFVVKSVPSKFKHRLLKTLPWSRRGERTQLNAKYKCFLHKLKTSISPTQISNRSSRLTAFVKRSNKKSYIESVAMETVHKLGEDEALLKDDVIIENTNITDGNDAVETSVLRCFTNIADGYSKVHGMCIRWETDVNLDPPKSWKEQKPDGDKYLKDYWNSLQYTLYEIGYPETIDRTHKPRTSLNKEHVNVALLSSPVECISILLEGGRQASGGFHLVMSPSWLSKTPINEEGSLWKLWLHKSISFHENGTTFIDEYTPPRPVTYLVNYFTNNVTSGHRNDGVVLEKDIDCPMSSPIKLCEMVDDKVWTREIMASVGMETPITLAVRKCPQRKLLGGREDLKHLDFSTYTPDDRMKIVEEVTQFCEKLRNNGIKKIVVKPSGPEFLGSIGVSFHDVTEVTEVVDAMETLFVDIDEGCSVLIEEFIEPLTPLKSPGAPMWAADEDLGFRVRATVCRDYDNIPVTTLINCNIGYKDMPINGDNTVCQTLESTLLGYNIHNKELVRDLENDIRVQCANVMREIIARENLLSIPERGSLRGQTDVIGIDIIITMKSGKLTPVGIEVNGHDCTINTQLFEFMSNLRTNASGHQLTPHQSTSTSQTLTSQNGTNSDKFSFLNDQDLHTKGLNVSSRVENQEKAMSIKEREKSLQYLRYHGGVAMGRGVRPLVRNMIARSQRYMMIRKKILVVGAGGVGKMSIWPDAKAYGIDVILVDSDPNHFAKDEVYKLLHCDFDDHNQDFAHARDICNQLQVIGEKVDGCLTFWEDCVPLAALLGEMLGTNGTSYKAALTGKKKSRTQNALRMRTGDIPHWPRTFLYASPVHHITSCDDIESTVKRIHFPAFLKLEHGSSAVGGAIVNNEDEIAMKFKNISNKLKSETDFPGIGLGHDNSMVVMDFNYGSEHDIDVIIYDRKLVGAFISDNGPTNVPYFVETSAAMPSTLPEDKQAQLVTAAYQCCTEIGLSDGTFNVEMKMTKMGPKLIEINARMGGFYLRDWIKRVYGVDLMFCAMMISAGIKPCIPKHHTDGQLMGIMLVPSHHGHIFRDDNILNTVMTMQNNGELTFYQLSNSTQVLLEQFEEPLANVTVNGTSVIDAKRKLKQVCKTLNIDNENYNVDGFLEHF